MTERREASRDRDEAETRADGFLFVGEALALDLVNTDIAVRGRPRELLAVPADLGGWWEAAQARYPGDGLESVDKRFLEDGAALEQVRAFRAALRRIFSAVADERLPHDEDLDALNQVLRAGFLIVGVGANGQLHQVSGSRDSGVDGILLPIARSALKLLTEQEASRLHRCANERCVLLFYDTTKSGTRRWCSTGCMNRARSSRRYRERRAALVANQN
jgi:predicted RNA-binding Zn ribbon-like protein